MTRTPHEPSDAAAYEEQLHGSPPDSAFDTAHAEQGQHPADVIVQLEAEKADLKDKLLRTLAEMENLRRRTERDVADARSYGIASFARDMLTVSDNMRRALDNIPGDVLSTEGPFKAFVEGVELTDRDLLKTLERHGVRQINPEGEKFNPNLHQAMFEIPNESVASGTILQVIQPGFVIGERVLRPAMVGVSKGGPKQSPVITPDDDAPVI